MENGRDIQAEKRIKQALKQFGRDVSRRREELDMTQGEASRRAGISQSHWSKIERGLHDLSIGQALRVQFALQAESLRACLENSPAPQS